MRWLGVVLAVGCVEDRSRAEGDLCWEDIDCVRPLVCDACGYCDTKDGPYVGLKGDEAVEACDERDDASEAGGLVCNDGSVSPTCTTCESGCCSNQGGCE